MIITCRRLLKNTKIRGITLFPFILLGKASDRSDRVLLNHEKIHLRQQLELLLVFFYLWYVIEFCYWYFRLGNTHEAYLSIGFEREAYANEASMDYLRTRKSWRFLHYLRRKYD
ncbi:hypothetical protein [Bergeyella sp. RCAD1439]|uniref:hypothetical protein n=1 Tax=Bergeyella anatis TaxID=3113737 RepID=UPI002E1919A8|nr:hypothetical protein [Bergeyella sp. RCAD1439]